MLHSLSIDIVLLNDVVNLENSPDKLGSEKKLLPLADHWVEHSTPLHVVIARAHAVDAKLRVTLVDLPTLDLCQRLDGRVAAVLGQGQRDRVECRGKSAHSILLQRSNLVSGLGDSDTADNFGSSTTVDDSVVSDQVSDDADGIVQRALGLVDDLPRHEKVSSLRSASILP